MSGRSAVPLRGPLMLYADGFRQELREQGYALSMLDRNGRILAHLSYWMEGGGIEVGELSSTLIEEFVAQRRKEGYRDWLSVSAVGPLRGYLRRLGVAPELEVAVPSGVDDGLLEDYSRYLVVERGLTPIVVRKYCRLAREFLAGVTQPGVPDLSRLSAAAVTDYVVTGCARRSPGSAKWLVTALRSVLRYLFLAGYIDHQLSLAVPTVANWGAGSLPRGISAEAVAALSASCDGDTVIGLRDRAILVLLARLGLRGGEVAALELRDFDWWAGEVSVPGKGSRRDRLPLPSDVGEALVAYLQAGRPRVRCRKVFLRTFAPLVGLTNAAVTGVVYRACRRAGLPMAGAHRLRHSAATAMLAGGAGLVEVGQVLRHAKPDTTSIYAKVDRIALGGLARPWPEVTA